MEGGWVSISDWCEMNLVIVAVVDVKNVPTEDHCSYVHSQGLASLRIR